MDNIITKYQELVSNPEVRIERVEGYGDYEFFSTGDVYSHKTNKFLGVNNKDKVSPNLYLYNTEGRINVSRGHVLGELFLDRTDARQNIVCQKIKGNDFSVDNLKWAIQAEVSAKNLREYLESVRASMRAEEEKKVEPIVQEAIIGEPVVPVSKMPNALNIWTVLFSILAVALAYKLSR